MPPRTVGNIAKLRGRYWQREVVVSQPVVLGFDPGREKCGLAVVGLDRQVQHQAVVKAAAVTAEIATLRRRYPISLIVMGNQTTAKTWKQDLEALPDSPRIMLVDERYSTLEARDRYWQMYPPTGLGRLVPQPLRTITRPIDDIVAILLVERYFNRLAGKPS